MPGQAVDLPAHVLEGMRAVSALLSAELSEVMGVPLVVAFDTAPLQGRPRKEHPPMDAERAYSPGLATPVVSRSESAVAEPSGIDQASEHLVATLDGLERSVGRIEDRLDRVLRPPRIEADRLRASVMPPQSALGSFLHERAEHVAKLTDLLDELANRLDL